MPFFFCFLFITSGLELSDTTSTSIEYEPSSRDNEDEGGDEDETEGEHDDHAQLVPPLLRLQHVRHLLTG